MNNFGTATGFHSFKNQLFGITLSNGYGIEVMFGPSHMCDAYAPNKSENIPITGSTWRSASAQVKIYKNFADQTEDFFVKHFEGAESTNLTPERVIEVISILGLLP